MKFPEKSALQKDVVYLGDYSSSRALPPSGLHDPTCAWLCKRPTPQCEHACKTCEEAVNKRRKP